MYSNYTMLCKTKGIAGTNFAKFFTPEDNIYDETKNVDSGEFKYKEFYTQEPVIKKPDASQCGKKPESIEKTKDILKRLIILEDQLTQPYLTINKERVLKQCMITELLIEENVTDKKAVDRFKKVSDSLFYDIKNNTLDNHKCYSYSESIKDVRYRLFGRNF